MKKLAKVLSLALVLVMVLSLGGTAWADPEPTTYSITIKVPVTDVAEHTYTAYQLFTGDLSQGTTEEEGTFTDATIGESVYGDRKLSNIQWGAIFNNDDPNEANGYRQAFVQALISNSSTNAACAELANDGEGNLVINAEAVADALSNINTKPSAEALANIIATLIKNNNVNPIVARSATRHAGDTEATIENLVPGYYFVKDEIAHTNEQPSSVSKYILQIVSNVTLASKTEIPSSFKKVDDKKDDDDSEDGVNWQDSADYDVGDHVPYKLTAFIPIDIFKNYSWYKLAFYDDMSCGLTFDSESAKVTAYQIDDYDFDLKNGVITKEDRITGSNLLVDQRDIDPDPIAGTSYEATPSGVTPAYPAGQKYKFNLGNIMDSNTDCYINAGNLDYANAKYVVVEIEYTTTLNEHAKINKPGNPNTSYLEFSNNPNDENEKGTTPEDNVIVFTYKAVIHKTDGTNPLTGAEFRMDKLYYRYTATAADANKYNLYSDSDKTFFLAKPDEAHKYVKTSKGAIILVENADATKSGYTAINDSALTAITAGKEYVEVYIPLELTKEGATFTSPRIDDGKYLITETQTPSGYNSIAPIELKLVAEHVSLSDNPQLTNVIGKDFSDTITWHTNENLENDDHEYSVDKEVINNQGTELPSTGGVGTTLFYVFGSMLVIAAAVYFVTKKRSEVE